MTQPLIEVRNFSYSYPRTSAPVLSDINLTVHEGEFVGIVGPTGAGKTTLCLALCGLIPHVLGGRIKGQISLAGKNTIDTPLEQLLFTSSDKSALVGITFQDPEAQLVGMTVEEDLAFGAENLGIPPEEIDRRIDETLRLVRMEESRNAFPYTLSGGQKQRIAIGSTLALRPRLLILDEPTSELDPVGRNEVFAVIRQLKEQANLSIVMVEHHTEELARFAERIVVLHEGRLILDDATTRVFQQTDLLRSVGVRPPEAVEFVEQLHAVGLIQRPAGLLDVPETVEYLRTYLDRSA